MKKDTVAALWSYLFSEDKKQHPMPPDRSRTLLQKIQTILLRSEKS